MGKPVACRNAEGNGATQGRPKQPGDSKLNSALDGFHLDCRNGGDSGGLWRHNAPGNASDDQEAGGARRKQTTAATDDGYETIN